MIPPSQKKLLHRLSTMLLYYFFYACKVYYPDQQMHSMCVCVCVCIYIYIHIYNIVSIPKCFNVSASSSGGLNHVFFVEVTKINKVAGFC